MPACTPEDIDAILPQTQCGLCGFGGCMPYAEALIFENASLDLCPPGGVPVLQQLGKLLSKDTAPHEDAMREKAKPALLAVIRENECIGCTKCIQACPVDAIIGSAKSMHSVISDECTGCELCVPACPVDCIDLITDPSENKSPDIFRARFLTRENRLAAERKQKQAKKLPRTNQERKTYLEAALERAEAKKNIST
tara:strand:+ start:264 stop:851 length:588 start_codon:yes stop_codon:yes gene_type:complete